MNSVKTLGFLGLLDDGVDVADLRDGFKNLLVLGLVVFPFLLGFLDRVVVVLH